MMTNFRSDTAPAVVEPKRCPDCDEIKPLSDYHKDARTRTGRKGICKPCAIARRIKWARTPRGRSLATATNRRFFKTEHGKKLKAKHCLAYQRRYPEKQAAHNAVFNAVRTGRLIKPSACAECGTVGVVEAHHADYARRLDVEWLCQVCHNKR